jgi:hypothetical protein
MKIQDKIGRIKFLKAGLNQVKKKKFKALPALLFSAIKKPKMIDLMAITTKPVKAVTSFGYRKMLSAAFGLH